jgi:DNA-directed RNA polymerase specialized sigma24 family protein
MEVMSRRQPILKRRAGLRFQNRRKHDGVHLDNFNSEENNRRQVVFDAPTPLNSAREEVTQEGFNRLLVWLNADRENAGEKYELIRKRLIKMFVCRGSNIAEELADRTINRVTRKLPEIQGTYTGDPAHYFVGVAQKIWLESIKREQAPVLGMPTPAITNEEDPRYTQLEKCLQQLTSEDRDLVLSYYQGDGRAKILNRRTLAGRLGLGINALRIRVCRIRSELLERVELCRSETERAKKN